MRAMGAQYVARMADASDRITLAGSDVQIPPMGVGTWAWGDRSTWGMGGYDESLTMQSIHDAWDACFDCGVVLFDTAEVYGNGESERILGKLLAEDAARRDRAVIASKFMPYPWRFNVERSLLSSLRASLDRLGIESVHLYQLHAPVSARSKAALADALVTAKEQGLLQAIGVSNYSEKEMRAIDGELRKRGARLASNQIEYSLLRRAPESVGLIGACHELGVVPLAYSPIGQGRLTGKYSAENPPPGKRDFSAHPMVKVDEVVAVLRRVGAAHGDRTPSQVALAWLMAKGSVPIPGAKNRRQAEDNAGALGWALTETEVADLDAVALGGKQSFLGRFFQHG